MTAIGVRTLVASVVLGTVLALPASASAVDTDNRCLVWAERYTLIEQTRLAVVFAKERNGIETHYGCVFSRERAYALPASGDEFVELELFQLDGRFVAYAAQSRDEAVNETHERIYVVDSRNQRRYSPGRQARQPLVQAAGPPAA